MNQDVELFINDVSVDLSPDNDIALSYQVNTLGDLQSLQNNFSKAFKLPLTQKNRIALGFPDDIPFTTNAPYTQQTAKLLIDGIEIIPNGLAETIDVQNGYVNIMILSGNCDFLDNIGGNIYDMGDSTTQWSKYGQRLVWKQYDHIWNVSNAANSQKNTSGWIWPIVNYGDITSQPPFQGADAHINVRQQRPAFFLHTAIELLAQAAGYRIDYARSCIYNDPYYSDLYMKLLVQFSNSDFEHGSDYQNTPDNLSATNQNYQNQIISNPRVDIISSSDVYTNEFPFEGVINFSPSDCYVATKNINLTATVQFNIYVHGKFTGGQPLQVDIKFVLVDTDGTINEDGFASLSISMNANYTRISGDGGDIIGEQTFLNQKLSQDFELVQGQKLYVKYHINNIGMDFNAGNTYAVFYAGAQFSIVTDEKLVLWNNLIQCERIFPDVSQLDLLKDTLQRQGLILISDPNTGTIIFTSLRKIVQNIPKALDWSLKCVDMGKEVAFQIGNYCQVNWLRYQLDDSIPVNFMPKYFMDDFIPINDKTLNPTQIDQDLFTSIFGPSLNRPYLGGSIAQISDPTVTDEFSVGSQPRILVDQKLDLSALGSNAGNLSVVFSDGDPGYETETVTINDIISVPYFYKPDGEFNLSFKDQSGQPGLKTKYYPEFQKVLTQTKKVTRYFYLKPLDIFQLDFTIPIYIRQDNAYYYIAKLDSWVKGNPCKAELIKLS